MKYEIEVCVKENDSNTYRGSLLEKIASEVLEVQQYKVVDTVRVTGIEIDVLARHKINDSIICVECKAWDTPLPADVITKLIGNRLIVLKDLDEVFKEINESDTICYVKQLIGENENIRSLEVGERLNDKFHRKWLRLSKMRYGNALLSWSKFLNQKFEN